MLIGRLTEIQLHWVRGKMLTAELERLIEKSITDGKIPFLVNATAGTTVFGAFDPINEIADICEKHHLWLHIDVQFTIINSISFDLV